MRKNQKQNKMQRTFDTLINVVVAAIQNFNGAFGTHDRNLCVGPRVVAVAAQMLRTHHIVRTAVRLHEQH